LKAFQNLHITLPVTAIISLAVAIGYVTTYAVNYDARLTMVERAQIQLEAQSDKNLTEIKGAINDMDTKFDRKIDALQADIKATLIELIK